MFDTSFSPYADYFLWQQSQKENAESRYRKQLCFALHTAMDAYRLENPEGFHYIYDYYLGNAVTQKKLGESYHTTEDAFRKRLYRNVGRLRQLAYRYLDLLDAYDFEKNAP